MRDQEIHALKHAYKNVLRPKARRWRPKMDCVVVAVDFESQGFEGHKKMSDGTDLVYQRQEAIAVSFAHKGPNGVVGQVVFLDGNVTFGELVQLAVRFLKSHGLEIKRELFLMSHFSVAEIRHLKDWFGYKVQVFNKGVTLRGQFDIGGKEIKAKIIDTFTHFWTGLDRVAEFVGEKKVSLEGVGGKPESYWKEHMLELRGKHPDVFRRYSLNDSIVLIRAWHRWRDFFIDRFGYDVLRAPTSAYISGDLFRLFFLKEPAEPIRIIEAQGKRREKRGDEEKWIRTKRKVAYYDGSKDKRYFALRAYKGGRREVGIYGYREVDGILLDFKQHYLECAYSQPLPTASTRWAHLRGLENLDRALELEGFVRARFEWPEGTRWPSIPVQSELVPRLMFPLRGESYFTICELREALRQGVRILDLEAWGFKPGPREIDHPLRRYLNFWRDQKSRAEKGTLEYHIAKLMPNALIGKFLQRVGEWDFGKTMEIFGGMGYDLEAIRDFLGKKRRYATGLERVGVSWAPEWGALITGRARAILGILFREGILYGHTDSGVLPYDRARIERLIERMKEFGATLEPDTNPSIGWEDGRIDAIWQLRAGVYALFRRGQIVKLGHHGYPLDHKDEFKKIVISNLRAGKPVMEETRKTHIVGPKSALRQGLPLGSTFRRATKIKWKWDYKRKLAQPDVNIWAGYSETMPYDTVEDAWEDEQRFLGFDKKKAPKSRGGRPILKLNPEEVRKLHEGGMSLRQLAKKFGVGKSTIWRICHEEASVPKPVHK